MDTNLTQTELSSSEDSAIKISRRLLLKWEARTRAVEKAHFERCRSFRLYHLCLGGAAIVCSTLFSALTSIGDDHKSIIIDSFLLPILVILSPVLTSLVSFLRLDEKSTLHHNAAAKFAALKRRLQLSWSKCAGKCSIIELEEMLLSINKEWDTLTSEAPALYKKEWSDVEKFDKQNQNLAEAAPRSG